MKPTNSATSDITQWNAVDQLRAICDAILVDGVIPTYRQ
jgi:hypothetical protein